MYQKKKRKEKTKLAPYIDEAEPDAPISHVGSKKKTAGDRLSATKPPSSLHLSFFSSSSSVVSLFLLSLSLSISLSEQNLILSGRGEEESEAEEKGKVRDGAWDREVDSAFQDNLTSNVSESNSIARYSEELSCLMLPGLLHILFTREPSFYITVILSIHAVREHAWNLWFE
ncbi:hypothetical protein V2J09_007790 [Rumex salicifolius]